MNVFTKHTVVLRQITVVATLILMISCSKGNISPVSLKCENVTDPFCIDATSPRLSWIDESKVNGEMQTAFEVRVSSSREKLKKADVWSIRQSSEDNWVRYKGPDLLSMQQCWWQVRVWDKNGKASRWSRPAKWGMGLLDESDWKAQWIGAPWHGEESRQVTADHHFEAAPYLRKSFRLSKPVASAKAYVTGLGFFELYINGKKVGDELLSPNETNWSYRPSLIQKSIPLDGSKMRAFRVAYCGYDVTDMLSRGENVIGAIIGNGFYNTNIGWVEPYGSPRFFGQLVITYKDGSREVVASDPTWLAHKSPITVDDLYEGETYDARMEIDGWCEKGLDVSDWEPAVSRIAPCGKLSAHYFVSDRLMNTLKPKSISKREDGTYEVDFGDYITGWVRLTGLKAPAGDTLRIKYISESPGNGPNNYIFRGSGNEGYAARFTWFAFDKVEISGYAGQLTAANLTAEEVYSDVRTTGHFECSNELFNRINHIWWRSQTDNMHLGTASDCPHREKGPYTGDGEIACPTVMHMFDARSFYTKWLRDMSDCQNVETGYVPNGAPWHPGCGGGVGWGAAMNIIPWQYYLLYGDRDLLEDYYFEMTEQLRHMRSWITADGTMYQQIQGVDGKPCYWMNLGDWLPPYGLPSEELVHTYLLWNCTDITARAARALGKDDDAAKYFSQRDEIAESFHKRFYDAGTRSYGDFGSNVFALNVGVPEEYKADVVETLRKEIAEKYDGHLNTGIIATQLLFETLADNGLNELAFGALNKRDFPSFGWWLEQGAYTTWEQWDGGHSHNHPMFGGGLTWLYRRLAGMQVDEDHPGYRHIIFKPMPCGDVTWAEYSNETSFGKAGICWERSGDAVKMRVKVPVGCTATVFVPVGPSYEQHEVASGEYFF